MDQRLWMDMLSILWSHGEKILVSLLSFQQIKIYITDLDKNKIERGQST
jgi:hypothetical protein